MIEPQRETGHGPFRVEQLHEAEREAILNCRDLEQLRVWLQRAVVVDTATALFK